MKSLKGNLNGESMIKDDEIIGINIKGERYDKREGSKLLKAHK
jgi:hypothetical protein